ncbi:MAG TPA: response regulator [Verrucomicrobiae bacterium]|nr:response regulator [Verrucomicrobiae bacterium]
MSKTKVLIVDDDVAASRLLGLGLEKTGIFQVKVENSATQALSRAREFGPDVILLDVCMPGADGGDVAFRIHGDAALRSTPIIFLTSLVSGNESGNTTVQRGGYEFLPKPASLAKVVECIDRHLGRQNEATSKLSLA